MLRNEWLAHLDGLVVFRGLLAAEPLRSLHAALAADDPGLYYIGDDATPENLTGLTRIYNAVDAAPGWRYGFVHT